MGRRQYRNPPIEEALCEFRFAPGPEWNWTIPGRLYERVKGTYAGRPRNQNVMEMEAGLDAGPQAAGASLTVKQGLGKVQFPTADGKRLLGVGPNVLSVHMFRPYPGWEEFHRSIDEARRAYLEIGEPEGVWRIGLRYINRIVVPQESVNLADFLMAPPQLPEGFPKTITAFISRTESVFEDAPVRLILTLASLKAPEERSAFLADLDLIREAPDQPLPPEQIMDAVDDLRTRERVAFEALITDKARELFNAE